jgi:hypothetical protein
MTENQNDSGQDARSDAERDLAEHERPGRTGTPDVGLIADEDLPEDLQPTDDNPLAKNPDDSEDESSGGPGLGGSSEEKVEGMPDMGEAGAPG